MHLPDSLRTFPPLQRAGRQRPWPARLRLRPILMTTLAAILGALPLLLGSGDGAEMRQPLGLTIIGGLMIVGMGKLGGRELKVSSDVDYIFILIVLVSVLPIVFEIGKRILASRRGETANTSTTDNSTVTVPEDPTP